MIGGGLFLRAKSTTEIHDNLEGEASHHSTSKSSLQASLGEVIAQITILDGVCSIDSLITAFKLVESICQ